MKPFSLLTGFPINRTVPTLHRRILHLVTAALALAIASGPLAAAQKSTAAAPAAPVLKSLDYSGNQQARDALDREIIAAGTDAAKLDAIATRLLTTLKQADATFASRQAICQRLGSILLSASGSGSPAVLNTLGTMLTSDRDVELARLALERLPGDAIDALFVKALPKTNGHTRVAVIQSIGTRQIASAVPALSALLNESESGIADAAAKALGNIGTADAAKALSSAARARSPAFVQAQFDATTHLPPPDALPVLQSLHNDASLPTHVRATAFRRLLEVQPAGAAARITQVLGGSDWTFKEVAVEAISVQPAAEIVPALVGKLANWDPATQVAVVAALGRKADPAASAALVQAAAHRDDSVRRAALEALGRLPGTAETAQLLARATMSGDSTDAKIARHSLARLNGPGVSEIVIAGAGKGDTRSRAMFLEQLALRNMTEATPLLLKTRGDSDATIRAAAVGALGEVGSPAELPAVLQWALAATDDEEQSRALRALVNIAVRSPATAERGQPVFQAIEQASPEVAKRLLPALSRLGGAASAECAARLALHRDSALATAAVTLLARWSDRTALMPLVSVAEKSPDPEVRTTAADAALKFVERNREPWSAPQTDVLGRLLKAAPSADARKRALALLNRGNDKAALALASKLETDPELGASAREVVETIKANRAGPPKLRASAGEEQLKNILDGKTDTRWSIPATGDDWLEVDFRQRRPLKRLTLDQTGRTGEFPERYEVFVGDDLAHLGAAKSSGTGQRNRTVIELPANTRGRYVVIKNLAEREDTPWTICELFVD
ncbi:MAG: HEAT repeat domain-containing protein [Opitutaceae bacterium]|nr:HEAT repeat domain-containing protein [Opitutaceae bacterium]